VAEFMQESIVFLVRVQRHCKKSSRSLSHLLMSFLFFSGISVLTLAVCARLGRPVASFNVHIES